jgi:hypothetical protein
VRCRFDNIVALLRAGRRFRADQSGNIAIVFALSAVMIVTAVGAGIDLSRAYLARQQMSQVASLACQYASRPSVIDSSAASYDGNNGGSTYSSTVGSYITSTWQAQKLALAQTNGSPFSFTQGGPANVSLASSVPTIFMQIIGARQIPIAVNMQCYATPASVVQRVPDPNQQYLVKESFEATPNGPVVGWTGYLPNGSSGFPTAPTTYTSAVGYTGANGTQWHITGYCLEQDQAGVIKSTVPDGGFSIELDCDRGDGTGRGANSAISTLNYMPAGTYELRYFYASRILYQDYGTAYICGTAASDTSWGNSTADYGGNSYTVSRTNQINVYLDINNANTDAPPTHTSLDGTTLAGANLIDTCLYGQNWLERSVMINVTTPGYYWLSFAADGSGDTLGGQLDNIRLCRISCDGTVQDNYTTAWAVSSLLFEDTLESPTYSFSSGQNNNGNANNAYGSSYFWDEQGNGWGNAPVNQLPYWNSKCPQSTQCMQLGNGSANTLIGKPFLLVPGYYQVSYMYQSKAVFASGVSACAASPVTSTTLPTGSGTATAWNSGSNLGTEKYDTNAVAMLMSHAQMASTPNRGNSLGSTTSYTNPDGSTSNTPTYSPASTTTPTRVSLLDVCTYSKTVQTRTASVFIQKPALYWLTLAALGTVDLHGGIVDDMKIVALGSPYMSSPPSGAVTIPVPSPQPSTTISNYTGFSITADPLAP